MFVGHQLGDQFESFLMRLFRRSGIVGLGTVSKPLTKLQGVRLARPLLMLRKVCVLTTVLLAVICVDSCLSSPTQQKLKSHIFLATLASHMFTFQRQMVGRCLQCIDEL